MIPDVQSSIDAIETYVKAYKNKETVYLRFDEKTQKLIAVPKPTLRERFCAFFGLRGFRKIDAVVKMFNDSKFQESIGDKADEFRKAVIQLNDNVIREKNCSILRRVFPISFVNLSSIPATKEVSPPDTTPLLSAIDYGNGIENKRGNFCYVNSTIQALRNNDFFKECLTLLKDLQDDELQSIGISVNLVRQLQAIYDVIEGKKGAVPHDQIDQFRKQARKEGWKKEHNETNQEDAAEFTLFLLRKLGIEPFRYFYDVDRELKVPIAKFDSEQRDIPLPLSIPQGTKKSTIQDLVSKNKINDSIDKQELLRSEWFHDYTETQKASVRAMEEGARPVSLKQAVQLDKNEVPALLPIQLKRYAMHGETSTKLETEIEPSEKIMVDIVGYDEQTHEKRKVGTATYTLSAVTVHSGSSLHLGHYYSYVPKKAGDRDIWVEFNDSNVYLHEKDEKRTNDDIRRNGYLFLYTLEKTE